MGGQHGGVGRLLGGSVGGQRVEGVRAAWSGGQPVGGSGGGSPSAGELSYPLPGPSPHTGVPAPPMSMAAGSS